MSKSEADAAAKSVTVTFYEDINPVQRDAAYTVRVNGVAVAVTNVTYGAKSVTLHLGTLQVGDSVVVDWSGLRDADGNASTGQSGAATAK